MDSKWFRWAILGILTVSAVLLNLDNIYISQILRDRQERATVSPGFVIEPFRVENIDEGNGTETYEILDFSEVEKNKLVFLISPTCHVCADNLPLWKDLEQRIDTEKYQVVVLVTIGGTRIRDVPGEEFIREKVDMYRDALVTPVRVIQRRSDIEKNRLSITPQTIILNEQGRVEKVWVGRISSMLTQREVVNVLGL